MADNDRHNPAGNIGIIKAQKACKELGLLAVIPPDFNPDEVGSDWNDYEAIHLDKETARVLRERIALELMPDNIKSMHRSGKLEMFNAQALLNQSLPPINH